MASGLRVARKEMGLTQEAFGFKLGVSSKTVARWESGVHEPHPWMRGKIAKLLAVSLAELSALLPSSEPAVGELVYAVDVLPVLPPIPVFDPGIPVQLGVGAADFVAPINLTVAPPTHVGSTEVDQVQLLTRGLAASENRHGGGLSAVATAAQLKWAAALLDARCDERTRAAMLESVGNLAGVVAFSAFDVGSHDAALRCFRFALWCAEQGGSWELRAATLADMARHAMYLGDLDEALSLIEFAQVRSDRLSATGRAMVSTVRARLLGLLGRFGEAGDQVTAADSFFEERAPDDDPPWLIYYDRAEHAGSTARALIPGALDKGREGDAAVRLRSAVELHREGYPRSRAFSGIRLACLGMSVGDPHEAVLVGRRALEDAEGVSSRRIERELAGLRRQSERHVAIPEVADLMGELPLDAAGA